jgi:predicted nucleotidyltransferase
MEIFSLTTLKAGEKLSQREIAKELKVSPTAVANSLHKLIKDNIILVEKTKTINFVSFNRDNKQAVERKRVENLKNIYISGLSDYVDTALAGATLIIFGSYARGEDTTTSDIDIAVIGRKEKELNLEKYEKILCRKININYYPDWTGIQKHLRNNILNGIILSGSVEL